MTSRIQFYKAADNGATHFNGGSLAYAIRTDADYATEGLRRQLARYLAEQGYSGRETLIQEQVNTCYQRWGHKVLSILSECLDYDQYALNRDGSTLDVHFYRSREMAGLTIANAKDLARDCGADPKKVCFVSLDDMIPAIGENFAEVAFSRRFSMDGKTEHGYVQRPGHAPLEKQFELLNAKLQGMRAAHPDSKTPIILLEDNVRRAKMINWLIGQMEGHGIFENAELIGISTVFCSANDEERGKIIHNNRIIPVRAVADHTGHTVDVTTPRDLLFDGFVVELNGELKRQVGLFMDVVSRFKVTPERAAEFRSRVAEANIGFCDDLESVFGVKPPLAWFDGGEAVAAVTGKDAATPMRDVLAAVL